MLGNVGDLARGCRDADSIVSRDKSKLVRHANGLMGNCVIIERAEDFSGTLSGLYRICSFAGKVNGKRNELFGTETRVLFYC